MATDHISREAAIAEIKRFIGYLDEDMIERLQIAIRRLPAADAAEVVRCKDCKFYTIGATAMCCAKGYLQFIYPGDYCSRGERRAE